MAEHNSSQIRVSLHRRDFWIYSWDGRMHKRTPNTWKRGCDWYFVEFASFILLVVTYVSSYICKSKLNWQYSELMQCYLTYFLWTNTLDIFGSLFTTNKFLWLACRILHCKKNLHQYIWQNCNCLFFSLKRRIQI